MGKEGSSGQYRKGSLTVGHRGTWTQEREGLGPGSPGVNETPSLTCCAHVAKCLNFSELPCPNSERGTSSMVVRGGELLGKAQGTWPYLLTSENDSCDDYIGSQEIGFSPSVERVGRGDTLWELVLCPFCPCFRLDVRCPHSSADFSIVTSFQIKAFFSERGPLHPL